MTSLHLTSLCGLALASAAIAAEIPVEPKAFTIKSSFTAIVAPEDDGRAVAIEPKAWSEFKIISIAPHGSSVKKGAVLMAFDPENLSKRLADTQRALTSDQLTLETAEQELKLLKETAPHRLEAAQQAAAIAKEENAYFTKTGREANEVESTQRLKRTTQYLENQKEELKQLQQMYAADDLTEETEEIILVRQKDDVHAAEIAVQMQTLDHKRTIEVLLPRRALSLTNAERDTAIALANLEKQSPRDIQAKEEALSALKVKMERQKQSLAELEHDSSLMEIKAPEDGIFYYGAFDQGEWITGDMIKTIVLSGQPPQQRPIATFIPKKAKRLLVAFTSEAIARPLKAGLNGIAQFPGREDISVDVTAQQVSSTPDPKGRYRVELRAEWPKNLEPAIGSSAKIRLITYHNENALVVPDKALSYGPKGWSVDLKLADGKTETRQVTRGRQSNSETEILDGLEAGQVIISSGN